MPCILQSCITLIRGSRMCSPEANGFLKVGMSTLGLETRARTTEVSAPPVVDRSGELTTESFTRGTDRSSLHRDIRDERKAAATREAPPLVDGAVQDEHARLIDRANNPDSPQAHIPLSPQVRQYIIDNPEASKHLIIPLGSKGVAYAGKTEYERAAKVLEDLNHSAERMLDMHEGGVYYNSKEFKTERSRSLRLAAEYHKLTGERPVEVGHSKYSNQKNRELWAAESARLQGSLDNAAYKAQEKQISFIKKHNLDENVSWAEGVKLDKGSYNRYVSTVRALSREGESHPIVASQKAEQRARWQEFQREQEQQRSVEQARQEIRLSRWAEVEPDRFQTKVRMRLRDNLQANEALVQQDQEQRSVRSGRLVSTPPVAEPVRNAPNTEPVKEYSPQARSMLDLARTVDGARADAIDTNSPEDRGLRRVIREQVDSLTVEQRGRVIRELDIARRRAPEGEQRVHDLAISLFQTRPPETEVAVMLTSYPPGPGLRTHSTEELQQAARTNYAEVAQAATRGLADLQKANSALSDYQSKLTPDERTEYLAELRAQNNRQTIHERVKQLTGDDFLKPVTAGGQTPDVLSTAANNKLNELLARGEALEKSGPRALNPKSDAAQLWNAASSATDADQRASILAGELSGRFARSGKTQYQEITAIQNELAASLGRRIAEDPDFAAENGAAYQALTDALSQQKEQIREDIQNRQELQKQLIELNRERASDPSISAAPGQLLARAYPSPKTPPDTATLMRYKTQYDMILEELGPEIDPHRAAAFKQMQRELSAGILDNLHR